MRTFMLRPGHALGMATGALLIAVVAGGGTPRAQHSYTPQEIAEGRRLYEAVDPKTGKQVWEFRMTDVTDSGVLTTATDLVFAVKGISSRSTRRAARCCGSQ